MPRIKKDIQQLCRSYTDGAVKTLVGIMNAPKAPAASRVMAAQAIIDRGWGKAKQEIGVDGTITYAGIPIPVSERDPLDAPARPANGSDQETQH